MKVSRLLLAAAALVVSSTVASAQTVEGPRAGVQRLNLVSANPIGLLFEWYNGELEHALSSTTSIAIAGSSFGADFDDNDDERYSVVDAIGRYYPSGRALNGFSIGLSVGFVDYRDNVQADCVFGCIDDSGTAGTIGVRGDYVWILGRDQHFSVAAGIGAKRVLGNDIGTEGLPIGRLSIGYAW
jgi:hypothetical protein